MAARSIGTATVTFGMVAINCKIYLACSAEAVAFNTITPDGHRVRQKLVDEVTGAEVNRDECSKGYEFARGQLVTFKRDELKGFEDQSSQKAVTIEKAVPASAVDLIQAEKSYYLAPDKGADRPYRLLVDALTESDRVAIAQWGTRGREHLVAIRARCGGLVMHTLYYADEVRSQAEVVGAIPQQTFSDRERATARALLDMMSEDSFELAAYKDRYKEAILAAVDAKVAGREVVLPAVPVAPIIVDLMEALNRSIAEKRAEKAQAAETPAATPQAPEAAPETPKKGKKGKKAA